MRAVGTENAWFSFKGIRNDSLDVRMLSMPTRPHPARKGKLVDIPAVDGKLWQDEGAYDRIMVSLRCIAADNANIDDVNAWLSGSGDLIFGDEPDRVYHARITKEFSRNNRSQRLRGQEFTVSFDCEPFRYSTGDPFTAPSKMIAYPTAATAFSVTNEGTVNAPPLFEVTSSNSGGSITIGGKTLTFSYCPKTLYIDCGAKIAYTIEDDGSFAFASVYVSGDWPVLSPGVNTVTIAPAQVVSNYITVKLSARWRWL